MSVTSSPGLLAAAPLTSQRSALRMLARLAAKRERKPTWRGSRILVENRRCNKPGCTKCPHGPYVYLLRDSKRTYLGPLISI